MSQETEIREQDIVDSTAVSNSYGISIFAGILFGAVGAAFFAGFTLFMSRYFVLMALVPAAAAGFGVSLGIHEEDSSIGAALGGFLGIASMAAGYVAIELSLPFLYTYNWGWLDWVAFIVGALMAIGWGANMVEEDD